MKKCSSCGTELKTEVGFCPNCGNEVGGDVYETPITVENNNKNNNKKIIIVGVIVVALVVLTAGFLLYKGTKKAEKTAIEYCEAIGNFDGKRLLKVFYLKGKTQEEKDLLVTTFDEYRETLEESGYRFISCKSKDVLNITGEDLEELGNKINDSYESEIEVTEAKEIKVILTAKVDGKEDSSDENVTVFKTDGKWYVFME